MATFRTRTGRTAKKQPPATLTMEGSYRVRMPPYLEAIMAAGAASVPVELDIPGHGRVSGKFRGLEVDIWENPDGSASFKAVLESDGPYAVGK